MSNATTAERTTVELPRMPGESNRAYEMRYAYVAMGPGRSLDKLRQKQGKTTATYTRQLEGWSTQYGWVACARKYDDEMTLIAIQEASAAYRKSLVDYRDRYGKMGKAIFEASARLLNRLNQVADKADVGPATLGIITNAARMAADLEALALQIEPLLEHFDDIDRS